MQKSDYLKPGPGWQTLRSLQAGAQVLAILKRAGRELYEKGEKAFTHLSEFEGLDWWTDLNVRAAFNRLPNKAPGCDNRRAKEVKFYPQPIQLSNPISGPGWWWRVPGARSGRHICSAAGGQEYKDHIRAARGTQQI